MSLLLVATFLSLSFFGAVVPAIKEKARKDRLDDLNTWRNFQAYAIKRYHPIFQDEEELKELTTSDIRKQFNTSGTYHQIR